MKPDGQNMASTVSGTDCDSNAVIGHRGRFELSWNSACRGPRRRGAASQCPAQLRCCATIQCLLLVQTLRFAGFENYCRKTVTDAGGNVTVKPLPLVSIRDELGTK